MTIENLRRKHKTILVDHAFRMYGVTPNHDQSKQVWVDYLLSGGNLKSMLRDLKQEIPLTPSCDPSQETFQPCQLSPQEKRIYNDLLSLTQKGDQGRCA